MSVNSSSDESTRRPALAVELRLKTKDPALQWGEPINQLGVECRQERKGAHIV